jgi:hypothetical protein
MGLLLLALVIALLAIFLGVAFKGLFLLLLVVAVVVLVLWAFGRRGPVA